jgi:demethylmenaquinone methyltransferase / 2-methoxy-6-polyprenyl-1,4-benzoquinol methylase
LNLRANRSGKPGPSSVDIGKLYSRLAPIYGFWGALTERRARDRALQVAELSEGQSALEVATGTGTFLARLAAVRSLRRVVGVDLAEGMVGRARRRIKSMPAGRAVLARADARRLPFAPQAFDVLFNTYMLDLLPEAQIPEVLAEFRRVLKPSGRLVALFMARQARVVQTLWMGLYRISPSLVGACRPIPIYDFLARNDWRVQVREVIPQCGFRSELFVARP